MKRWLCVLALLALLALAAAPAPSLTDGLTAYWTFDQRTKPYTDAVGEWPLAQAGYAYVPPNGTTIAGAAAQSTAGSYVRTPYTPTLGFGYDAAWTLAGWIRPTSNFNAGLVGQTHLQTFGSAVRWRILTNSAGQPCFTAQYASGGYSPELCAAPLVNREWQHLALVVDGNDVALAVNGVAVTATLTDAVTALYLQHPIHWGANTTGFYTYHGRLDEWGYWSRALSADELNELVARRDSVLRRVYLPIIQTGGAP